MILTDRPLEEIMHVIMPEIDIEPEMERLHITDTGDLPFGIFPTRCRTRLKMQCIELYRLSNMSRKEWDWGEAEYFDGDVNRYFGTDSLEWNAYELLNRDVSGPAFYSVFVYWCLAHGCDHVVIMLPNGEARIFDQDVPIAEIDIGDKSPGMSPSRYQLKPDVWYHFIDPGRTAHRHDTSILERIGKDMHEPEVISIKDPSSGEPVEVATILHRWFEPASLNLEELIGSCGNSIRHVTVYDSVEASNLRFGDRCEPIACITLSDEQRTGDGIGASQDDRMMLGGYRVIAYRLYDGGYNLFRTDMGCALVEMMRSEGCIGLCALIVRT